MTRRQVVGFHYFHELQTEHGIEAGFAAYNGSGPAAIAYGQRAMALRDHFLALTRN